MTFTDLMYLTDAELTNYLLDTDPDVFLDLQPQS